MGGLPPLRVDNRFEVIEDQNIVDADLLNKLIDTYLDDEEKKKLSENKSLITVKDFSNLRFKASFFYQKKMPSVTFYGIPAAIKTLDELKLPAAVKNFINLTSGLLVIAGPHQAGKTSTAAAFIEEMNRNKNKRIITLEDPIERLYVSQKSIIEQRQIGIDVRNLEEGLDYALKEDVDLVYIGEMADISGAEFQKVMELGSGNALVILEMNAQNSIGVLEKIFNGLIKEMNNEAASYLISDVLSAIVVQKLLPKRGGGMVMAQEIAINNPAMKSLLREGKIYQIESVIETSKKEGMVNMQKVLDELVESGEVRQDDVY